MKTLAEFLELKIDYTISQNLLANVFSNTITLCWIAKELIELWDKSIRIISMTFQHLIWFHVPLMLDLDLSVITRIHLFSPGTFLSYLVFIFYLMVSIEGFLSYSLTHTYIFISLSLSILFQVFPEFYIHICNIRYIWWQSISLVSSTVVLEIGFDIQRHIPHTMIKAKSE